MPQPAEQEASASVTESFPGADQLTCVAPGVLSHGHTKAKAFSPFDAQAQPREVVDLDAHDAPEMVQEGGQSEADEIESSVSDEMDVDDSAQDSASEDGLHDSDAEDEPADDATDIQSNLLRDAGAQYTKADEVLIKASPSQVRLGVDTPQIDLDDETQASAVIQSLIKKGKLGEMLKKFGYQAPEEAEPKETKDQKPQVASSNASDSGRINKCQECHKTFQRRCELKYATYSLSSLYSLTTVHQETPKTPRKALRLHLCQVRQEVRQQERLEAARKQPALPARDLALCREGGRPAGPARMRQGLPPPGIAQVSPRKGPRHPRPRRPRQETRRLPHGPQL
jgi:hypothetical protein